MDYAIVQLPVQILKQGRLYIAYSHELDISTTGKSEKQAVDQFGNIINIFLKEAIQRGGLDRALTDLGWTRKTKRWSPPAVAHVGV